jgi:uncharacterized membrane protein YwzB
MSGKFFIYIVVSILVIWSLESLNINGIFKKNRVYQATTFYFLIALSMIYLVTNFVYDIFVTFKLF